MLGLPPLIEAALGLAFFAIIGVRVLRRLFLSGG